MINEYHNAIQNLISLLKRRGQSHTLIVYEVKEDERNDPTLVSQRIYKNRQFADVIRVACGVSFAGEALPLGLIHLPTLVQIIGLKNKYGVR